MNKYWESSFERIKKMWGCEPSDSAMISQDFSLASSVISKKVSMYGKRKQLSRDGFDMMKGLKVFLRY